MLLQRGKIFSHKKRQAVSVGFTALIIMIGVVAGGEAEAQPSPSATYDLTDPHAFEPATADGTADTGIFTLTLSNLNQGQRDATMRRFFFRFSFNVVGRTPGHGPLNDGIDSNNRAFPSDFDFQVEYMRPGHTTPTVVSLVNRDSTYNTDPVFKAGGPDEVYTFHIIPRHQTGETDEGIEHVVFGYRVQFTNPNPGIPAEITGMVNGGEGDPAMTISDPLIARFTRSGPSVEEGDSPTPAVFTLVLEHAPDGPATVTYTLAVTGPDAVAGDISAVLGGAAAETPVVIDGSGADTFTINISGGNNTATLDITPVSDVDVTNETATFTITGIEVATLSLEPGNLVCPELCPGGALNITVTDDLIPPAPLTTYVLGDPEAIEPVNATAEANSGFFTLTLSNLNETQVGSPTRRFFFNLNESNRGTTPGHGGAAANIDSNNLASNDDFTLRLEYQSGDGFPVVPLGFDSGDGTFNNSVAVSKAVGNTTEVYTFRITPTHDTDNEGVEHVVFGYRVHFIGDSSQRLTGVVDGGAAARAMTIVDAPTATLTQSGPAMEDDDSPTPSTFTLTLDNAPDGPAIVAYTLIVSGGISPDNGDISAAFGDIAGTPVIGGSGGMFTINVSGNNSAATLAITPVSDEDTDDETVTLTITSIEVAEFTLVSGDIRGAGVTGGGLSITVTDDDEPETIYASTDREAVEPTGSGTNDADTGTFTLRLSNLDSDRRMSDNRRFFFNFGDREISGTPNYGDTLGPGINMNNLAEPPVLVPPNVPREQQTVMAGDFTMEHVSPSTVTQLRPEGRTYATPNIPNPNLNHPDRDTETHVFRVIPTHDGVDEMTEHLVFGYRVFFSDGGNLTGVVNGSATAPAVTITDAPRATLTRDFDIIEEGEGATPATFTLALDNAPDGPATVTYTLAVSGANGDNGMDSDIIATFSGTAAGVPAIDSAAARTTTTVVNGSAEINISVIPLNDDDTIDERITLTIHRVEIAGYTLEPGVLVCDDCSEAGVLFITLLDSTNPEATYALTDPYAFEPAAAGEDAGTGTFTITLSNLDANSQLEDSSSRRFTFRLRPTDDGSTPGYGTGPDIAAANPANPDDFDLYVEYEERESGSAVMLLFDDVNSNRYTLSPIARAVLNGEGEEVYTFRVVPNLNDDSDPVEHVVFGFHVFFSSSGSQFTTGVVNNSNTAPAMTISETPVVRFTRDAPFTTERGPAINFQLRLEPAPGGVATVTYTLAVTGQNADTADISAVFLGADPIDSPVTDGTISTFTMRADIDAGNTRNLTIFPQQDDGDRTNETVTLAITQVEIADITLGADDLECPESCRPGGALSIIIRDDDGPEVSLSRTTVSETMPTSVRVSIETLSLPGNSGTGTISVSIPQGGTANSALPTAGLDYTYQYQVGDLNPESPPLAVGNSDLIIEIPEDQVGREIVFSFTPINDNYDEAEESITINFGDLMFPDASPPLIIAPFPPAVTIRIEDDDEVGAALNKGRTAVENSGRPITSTFTLTITRAPDATARVTYTLGGGLGTKYTADLAGAGSGESLNAATNSVFTIPKDNITGTVDFQQGFAQGAAIVFITITPLNDDDNDHENVTLTIHSITFDNGSEVGDLVAGDLTGNDISNGAQTLVIRDTVPVDLHLRNLAAFEPSSADTPRGESAIFRIVLSNLNQYQRDSGRRRFFFRFAPNATQSGVNRTPGYGTLPPGITPADPPEEVMPSTIPRTFQPVDFTLEYLTSPGEADVPLAFDGTTYATDSIEDPNANAEMETYEFRVVPMYDGVDEPTEHVVFGYRVFFTPPSGPSPDGPTQNANQFRGVVDGSETAPAITIADGPSVTLTRDSDSIDEDAETPGIFTLALTDFGTGSGVADIQYIITVTGDTPNDNDISTSFTVGTATTFSMDIVDGNTDVSIAITPVEDADIHDEIVTLTIIRVEVSGLIFNSDDIACDACSLDGALAITITDTTEAEAVITPDDPTATEPTSATANNADTAIFTIQLIKLNSMQTSAGRRTFFFRPAATDFNPPGFEFDVPGYGSPLPGGITAADWDNDFTLQYVPGDGSDPTADDNFTSASGGNIYRRSGGSVARTTSEVYTFRVTPNHDNRDEGLEHVVFGYRVFFSTLGDEEQIRGVVNTASSSVSIADGLKATLTRDRDSIVEGGSDGRFTLTLDNAPDGLSTVTYNLAISGSRASPGDIIATFSGGVTGTPVIGNDATFTPTVMNSSASISISIAPQSDVDNDDETVTLTIRSVEVAGLTLESGDIRGADVSNGVLTIEITDAVQPAAIITLLNGGSASEPTSDDAGTATFTIRLTNLNMGQTGALSRGFFFNPAEDDADLGGDVSDIPGYGSLPGGLSAADWDDDFTLQYVQEDGLSNPTTDRFIAAAGGRVYQRFGENVPKTASEIYTFLVIPNSDDIREELEHIVFGYRVFFQGQDDNQIRGVVNTASSSVSIADVPPPAVTADYDSAADVAITEGSGAGATRTVMLANAPNADATATFTLADGTTADVIITVGGGADNLVFTSGTGGTFRIPAGDSSVTITFTPADDDGDAVDETITFSITGIDFAGTNNDITSSLNLVIRITESVNICGRTAGVQTAIINAIVSNPGCTAITQTQLDTVVSLDIGIASTFLQTGDFANLANLRQLLLSNNNLERLARDQFNGLDALEILRLNVNPGLTSLPDGLFDDILDTLTELVLDAGLRRTLSLSVDSNDLSPGQMVTLEFSAGTMLEAGLGARVPYTVVFAAGGDADDFTGLSAGTVDIAPGSASTTIEVSAPPTATVNAVATVTLGVPSLLYDGDSDGDSDQVKTGPVVSALVAVGPANAQTLTITDSSFAPSATLTPSDLSVREVNNISATATLTLADAATAGTATVSFELSGATFGTRLPGNGFTLGDADYLLDITIGGNVTNATTTTGTFVLPPAVREAAFRIIPIADGVFDVETVAVVVTTVTFSNENALPITTRPTANFSIVDYGTLPTAALSIRSIEGDNPATPGIDEGDSITNSGIDEGGDSGLFILEIEDAPNGPGIAVVTYNLVVDSDAIVVAEFGLDAAGTAVIGTGTFTMDVANRRSTATLTITSSADDSDTTNDVVAFTVTGITFTDIGTGTDIGVHTHNFRINDDDPSSATVAIDDMGIINEDQNIGVTVTLVDRVLPQAGMIHYRILPASSGAAIDSNDVSSVLFGNNSFAASEGEDEITFTVDVADDNHVEQDTEGGIVRIVSVTWGDDHTLDIPATLPFTITDNDGITLTLNEASYEVRDNAGTLGVTVIAAPNPSPSTHTDVILDRAVAATLVSTDGSASAAEDDYATVNETLTYGVGSPLDDRTVSIAINDDGGTGDETFTLALEEDDRAVTLVAPDTAAVTIVPAVTAAYDSTAVITLTEEATPGSGDANSTTERVLILSHPPAATATVSFTVSGPGILESGEGVNSVLRLAVGGGATGLDINEDRQRGRFTIPAGDTSVSLTFTAISDTDRDGENITFTINRIEFADASGETDVNAPIGFDINVTDVTEAQDNPTMLTGISIANSGDRSTSTIAEGEEIVVTITLDSLFPQNGMVQYRISGGSGDSFIQGHDVEGDVGSGTTSTATPGGGTTTEFIVNVVDDNRIEPPLEQGEIEILRLDLPDGTRVPITGTNVATFTIRDNDRIRLSAADQTVSENTAPFEYTVTATAAPVPDNAAGVVLDRAVTATLTSADGSADAEDYAAAPAVTAIVFPASTVAQVSFSGTPTISVSVENDGDPVAETFTFTLTSSDAAAVIENATATATATITIGSDPVSVFFGGATVALTEDRAPVTRTLTVSRAPGSTAIVSFGVSGGRLSIPGDSDSGDDFILGVASAPGVTDVSGLTVGANNTSATFTIPADNFSDGTAPVTLTFTPIVDADTNPENIAFSVAGIEFPDDTDYTVGAQRSSLTITIAERLLSTISLTVTSEVGDDMMIVETDNSDGSGPDDTAMITLTVSNVPADATEVGITYDLAISGASTMTDDITVTGASVGTRQTLTLNSIDRAADTASTVITVTANNDDDEDDETVTFTVTALSFANAGFADRTELTVSMTIEIDDNDGGICGRTDAVEAAIRGAIGGNISCANVLPRLLSEVSTLTLTNSGLSGLQPGDFDGLTALRALHLNDNALDSLPAGIFNGLTNLTELHLNNNDLNLLPAEIFDGLAALTELRLNNNSNLAPLPTGIFDDVLDTLTVLEIDDDLKGRLSFAGPSGILHNVSADITVQLSPAFVSVETTVNVTFGGRGNSANFGNPSPLTFTLGSSDTSSTIRTTVTNAPIGAMATFTFGEITLRYGNGLQSLLRASSLVVPDSSSDTHTLDVEASVTLDSSSERPVGSPDRNAPEADSDDEGFFTVTINIDILPNNTSFVRVGYSFTISGDNSLVADVSQVDITGNGDLFTLQPPAFASGGRSFAFQRLSDNFLTATIRIITSSDADITDETITIFISEIEFFDSTGAVSLGSVNLDTIADLDGNGDSDSASFTLWDPGTAKIAADDTDITEDEATTFTVTLAGLRTPDSEGRDIDHWPVRVNFPVGTTFTQSGRTLASTRYDIVISDDVLEENIAVPDNARNAIVISVSPAAIVEGTDEVITYTFRPNPDADTNASSVEVTLADLSGVTGAGTPTNSINVLEGERNLTFNITEPVAEPPSAVTGISIDDDDNPGDGITSTIAESDTIVVTVVLDNPLPATGTISYSIVPDGGDPGSGIMAHDVDGSVVGEDAENTVDVGVQEETTYTFTVNVMDDNRIEPFMEHGRIQITGIAWNDDANVSGSFTPGAAASATFTITDNDQVALSIPDASVRDSAGTLTYTVTAAAMPQPAAHGNVRLDREVTALLSTDVGGDATAGDDYIPFTDRAVTFSTTDMGQRELRSGDLSIIIISGSEDDEEEETFILRLDSSVPADPAVIPPTDDTATVTILPAVTAGYDSTATITLIEGESTVRTLTLTNAPNDATATVSFALTSEADVRDRSLTFTAGDSETEAMNNLFIIPAAASSVSLTFAALTDADSDDSTITFTITGITFEGDDSMTDITALDTLTITITDTSSRTDAVLNAVDPDVNASEINNATADAVLTLIGNAAVAGTATVSFELGGDAVFGTRSDDGFDPGDADYLLDILIGDDVIPAMASTGTLVLPPAVRGINFRITPIADADDEGLEAVEVIVSTITFTNGEMLSERLAATLNIADYGDLPTAALDITADTAEGGGSGVFTLTLDNAPNGPGIAEVSYSLAADADAFTAATFGGAVAAVGDSTFTMTVAGRTATATLTVTPGADADVTDDTVTFTVTGVTFTDIGIGTDIIRSSITGTDNGAQTLTIADDDPTIVAAVSIDHDDGEEDTPTSTIAERENINITLTLDKPLPGDGTVRYTILPRAGSGAVIERHDVSSAHSFGVGNDNVHITSASSDNLDITFTVDIEDDNRIEKDTEEGAVKIISVNWETHRIDVNATLNFTIVDNDGITLTLDAGEYLVRDNAGTLPVTVNAEPTPIPSAHIGVILDRAVTATLTSTDGTAVSSAEGDYTAVNRIFNYAASPGIQITIPDQTADITIRNDRDTPTETFTITLDGSDRAVTLGTTPTATVTIVPNIEANYDSTADIALIEGTGADSTARRTLTLTHAPDAEATVFFALAGGEVDGGSAADPSLIFTTGEDPMTPMINRTGPRANMIGSFTIPAANVGVSVALNFGTVVDANSEDSTIMFTITSITFEDDDSMTDLTALDTLTITITDTLSRTDAVLIAVDPDADEVNNATADATLTLVGNEVTAGTATVSFELGGDAVFGTRLDGGGFDPVDADYLLDILIGDDVIPAMASTGTLVLPPADVMRMVNFRITPIADADDEGSEAETVEVIVSTITFTNGEMLSERLAATLKIADYGPLPTAALDATDGAEGGDNGIFTLSLDNAPNGVGIAEVSYNLAANNDAFTAATFGGAAAAAAAIGDSTFTMTVVERTATATLTITPGADADVTDDTITFTVTGVTFADIGTGTDIARSSVTGTDNGAQTLTIADDDPTTFTAVLIDRDDDEEDTPAATIAEHENINITLTLDRPLPGDGTVRYTILPRAGSDAAIEQHDVSSALNFGAGNDNVHITPITPASSDNLNIAFIVDIEDDNRIEKDTEEGVVKIISIAWETHEIDVNATLNFTIVDNDGIILTLNAGEYSVNNNEETLTVTVNAALNPDPSAHTEIILDRAVTATLTSTDGTATVEDEDYTAVNRVFNYAASTSTQITIPVQTFGITIVNDRDTPTETFTLTLDGSDRAVTLGTSSATVTITGDAIIQGIRLRIRAFLEGALQ